MKKIMELYSDFEISKYEIWDNSKEFIDNIIKENLAHRIAEFIMEHEDEVPMKKMMMDSSDKYGPKETHRIEITIIDSDELKRLKLIEQKYVFMNR
jgi:aspartate carbamoyltransferase regulatory subunit